MYLLIYRYILYPFLYLSFKLLAVFNPKIKLAFALRKPINSTLPWLKSSLASRPVWFHCASGEFEYAKPVINALKVKYPGIKILVTYFSPSVVESIEKFKNVDFYCPVPWDHPKALQDFLAHHAPHALLIARTDAWPEMLMQAKEMKIPSLLFSATISNQSSRMNWFAMNFTAWTLQNLSEIHCVCEDDFANFERLNLGSITKVCGDTRYDQVIDRLKNPKPIKDALFRHKPSEKILVAGSTWPEDEAVLLQMIKTSLSKGLNYRFVLVPHEPSEAHISSLRQKALALNITTELYSEQETWSPKSVLIVNQIGILAEIYAYALVAFVGGSFRKSVHSVMEPLAAGCISLVGPKHKNNREALFMKSVALQSNPKIKPVMEMKKAQDFITLLKEIEKKDLTETSKEIQKLVQSRAGEATEKVLNWLKPYLNS